MSAGTEQRKLAAIMFTDMVGYSALTQRNETIALELLEEHRALLRSVFPRFNGTEIKTIGDAFLVEFSSALEAAQCAIGIQRTLAHRNTDFAAEKTIQVRIGIHIGDVVHRGGDVYGDGVNIASRIEPLAGPGGICISVDVERQIRNAIETSLVKLGPTELKNIQLPMELFRIVLPWEKPPTVPQTGAPRPSSAPAPSQRGEPVGASEAHRPLGVLWLGTATLLVLVVTAAGWWWFRDREASRSSTKAAGRITSLAVKPLDDFSGDTNQAYLSDGMTEALCMSLGNISSLRVPGRSSVVRYRGSTNTIQQMAADLKVDAIVEGSIQRAANRILVTVQLIEAATDRHLWATNYQRDLSDFFQVQNELALAIADEIKVRLAPKEKIRLAALRTTKPEVVEAYLKGRFFWNKRTEEGFKRGLAYFNQAIEKDPSYAPAYAGIASTYDLLGHELYCIMHPREAYPKAKAAARKALELDEALAEAHAVLAYCHLKYDWDWVAAEREFKRAIDLNPNYATAHQWYSHFLLPMGRVEESLAESRRALELDPLSLIINLHLGWHYLYVRDYDQAITQLQATLDLAQGFAVARLFLGQAYEQKGRFEEAISELENGVRLSGRNPVHLAALAHAYAASGLRAEAEKLLEELKEASMRRYVPSYEIAVIYAGLKQNDEALTWLEKAYEQRDSSWLVDVGLDPRFEPLRSGPRFIELLRKMGLKK